MDANDLIDTTRRCALALVRADSASLGIFARTENAADHAEWDEFLERTYGGDLVQSSAWARIKAASGMEAHRVVVRLDGAIVGGAQLIARRVPVIGAVAYVPYGPVVAPDAPAEAVSLLVERLRGICRESAVRGVFVQPPDGGERVATALRAVGFEPTEVDVAPAVSVRIDLGLAPAELLDRMSKHTRQDVKKSFREPIRVRFATRADLPTFYELYCCTAARQNFAPLPMRYLEVMWDQLHPAGRLEILLADVNGVDVAGNMVSCFGDMVTGRLLGFDETRLPKRLRPNEALIWAALGWARQRGFRSLDVGGVGRAAGQTLVRAEHAVGELKQAPPKLGFGGTAVFYPEPLELILNPVLRIGYRVSGSNKLALRLRESVAGRARTAAIRRN